VSRLPKGAGVIKQNVMDMVSVITINSCVIILIVVYRDTLSQIVERSLFN
jgi:hypothetical protein